MHGTSNMFERETRASVAQAADDVKNPGENSGLDCPHGPWV